MPFILGSIELQLTLPKLSGRKGRRPKSDASIEDAEAFDEFGLSSDSGSPEAIAMGDELVASSMRRCRHCRRN